MKITERIKKIRKLIGSDIYYFHSDEFFTPKIMTSKIIGLEINNIFDINLIVVNEGVISPLNSTKNYDVFKVIKLPLIKLSLGKHVFPQYGCVAQNVKSIFITKNDIDSSLLKDSDYDMIDNLKEINKKMKVNVIIKKNFVCEDEIRSMCKMFKISSDEARELREIGLSPYGWRNTLSETVIFNPSYFNLDIVHDINMLTEKIEEIEIYLGLLKLSKKRLIKN